MLEKQKVSKETERESKGKFDKEAHLRLTIDFNIIYSNDRNYRDFTVVFTNSIYA